MFIVFKCLSRLALSQLAYSGDGFRGSLGSDDSVEVGNARLWAPCAVFIKASVNGRSKFKVFTAHRFAAVFCISPGCGPQCAIAGGLGRRAAAGIE